jgi:predicted  nucleic acid-binding Zn-ribbon protein
MADDYTPIFAALHQATQASISANAQLIATNAQLAALAQALTTATDATRHARDEHADVRETVDRLETLVTDLQHRLNKLEG